MYKDFPDDYYFIEQMSRKINMFAIYAEENKDIMLGLIPHLETLSEALNVSIWYDDPIVHGQPWKTYFESRLHHTDIFLLLLSDAFMNSQFIAQSEFKSVIDRHKSNKSVIIPVIGDHCKWDIDHKLTDYEFNLRELQVLPDGGKPIVEWDSPDEAYSNIAAGISAIIAPISAKIDQEESIKETEDEAINDIGGEQVEISSAEKGEADSMLEELIRPEKEIEAAEENRLWEEAEAKRRAEVAKRLREEAEASAKRRAEEDRLWEEALEKRRAEKEKRILEGTDSLVIKKEEEKERDKKEEANKKKIAKETTIRRTHKEKGHDELEEVKSHAEDKKRVKSTTKVTGKVEGIPPAKDSKIRKRVLAASLAVVLTAAGIWAYSLFKGGSEIPTSPLLKTKEKDIKDSIAHEKANTEYLNKVSTSPKLGIGDIYNGGIIFEINDSDNTVKIAHFEDAGPMPWQNAVNIHEQLGEGWRLPTLDELSLMYQTIGQGANNTGEFNNELYWSNTAYDENQARLLRFWDGNTSFHYNKHVEHRKFRVRAIRELGRESAKSSSN